MNDIALAVGATYFSEKTGDDLSHMGIEDLGKAKKVIVGRDDTIIINDKKNNEEINNRVIELWEQHQAAKQAEDKDFIVQRIAGLTGGIGVIYVGANSDVEQKEKFDRVDVKLDVYGDMFELGIVDPLKVTKKALRNAVSVATTILSTNAIITLARHEK